MVVSRATTGLSCASASATSGSTSIRGKSVRNGEDIVIEEYIILAI